MSEKKNYCVDGVCTNTAYDMNCCDNSCCLTIDCVYLEMGSVCSSPSANAKYSESQKTKDRFASIRQLTPEDREEILEFALKRSAEMMEEE